MENQSLDEITRRVSEMYDRFPYPSPEMGTKKLKELSNLLTIFSRETGFDFRGKRVLDAGTGTGHRLLEAARVMKETSFLAVDVSDRPLAIARATAEAEGIGNVEFRPFDLMAETADLGRFDVVLCMGVLHHLADPQRGLRNLVRHLSDEGILFLYVYGSHGSQERMRRKQIVSLLLGKDRSAFEHGIQIVKDLEFDSTMYGWNLNIEGESTKDSLFVDSYLNVHECLFESESLFQLVRGSGLDGFMTFGITVDHAGYLFETRLEAAQKIMLQRTELAKKLSTPLLAEGYERLNLRERYQLLDLLYQPNGYTLIGLRAGARGLFPPESRLLQNTIWVDDYS
ncbi:MAG: methyltransferase domain-containing protein [Blastocatellia bacterium]|nr:methyltransferase domain-containing protein [Blastocatellia bacterium]